MKYSNFTIGLFLCLFLSLSCKDSASNSPAAGAVNAANSRTKPAMDSIQTKPQPKLQQPPADLVQETEANDGSTTTPPRNSVMINIDKISPEMVFPFGIAYKGLTHKQQEASAGDATTRVNLYEGEQLLLVNETNSSGEYGGGISQYLIQDGQLTNLYIQSRYFSIIDKDSAVHLYTEEIWKFGENDGVKISRYDTLPRGVSESRKSYQVEKVPVDHPIREEYEREHTFRETDITVFPYVHSLPGTRTIEVFLTIPEWQQTRWIMRDEGFYPITKDDYQDFGIPAKAMKAWSTREDGGYINYIEKNPVEYEHYRSADMVTQGSSSHFLLENQIWEKKEGKASQYACYESPTLSSYLSITYTEQFEPLLVRYEKGSDAIPVIPMKYYNPGNWPEERILYAEIWKGMIQGVYEISKDRSKVIYHSDNREEAVSFTLTKVTGNQIDSACR